MTKTEVYAMGVFLTKEQLVYLRDLVTEDYLRTMHYEGSISDKFPLIADVKTALLTAIYHFDNPMEDSNEGNNPAAGADGEPDLHHD